MVKELISVILPVYNAEEHLAITIESVLNQTNQHFELIIINDGSTDNSSKICQKYQQQSLKIKYFSIKNQGVSNARNYALNKATGTYVTFIDSDDWYAKDFLEVMYKNLKKYKADIVSCAYNAIGSKIKIVNYHHEISTKNFKDYIEILQPNLLFNQLWNKIYNLEIIKQNNLLFDTTIDLGEDYKFNLDYINNTQKLIYINKPLYNYRINANGLGFKYRTNSSEIKFHILKYLETIYANHHFDKNYINKSYIIQYFAYFSNIVDKNNKDSKKEKLNKIKKIITSLSYNEKINDIKNTTNNKKINLACFVLLINNKYFIYYLGKLANIYDKLNKAIKISKR